MEVGHADTDESTVLHAPSIGLVVAGDVVYNGVHLYLREAADDGISRWLQALDRVASLHPTSVIAGHKNKTRTDSAENIQHTQQYLLDAERLLGNQPTPLEFFHAMVELHPDRLNPGALWSSAVALLA